MSYKSKSSSLSALTKQNKHKIKDVKYNFIFNFFYPRVRNDIQLMCNSKLDSFDNRNIKSKLYNNEFICCMHFVDILNQSQILFISHVHITPMLIWKTSFKALMALCEITNRCDLFRLVISKNVNIILVFIQTHCKIITKYDYLLYHVHCNLKK